MREMENTLPRPGALSEYICAPGVRARLTEALASARARGALPPHMLFSGLPGTGKTTAALVIAQELRLPVFKFVGCELRKPAQLRALLQAPACGAVVFLDEVHAIGRDAAEMLYPIMEDRVISAVGDPRLRLHLNPLMVVGATTEPGEMPRPLRERFVLHVEIPEYTVEQIQQIAAGQARRLGRVEWLAGAVGVVAGACKGIPRISGQLLWQARDFVLARGASVVTAEDVRCVLERAGIGQNGLDPVDQAVIRALRDAPMGLEALASVVGQDAALIRREHEPYLLRRGYIRRTGRGRELTESGKELKI